MRIFNFRYLLIAAAMLAVWLLARSRTTGPELDASWTPITVNAVDALASTKVADPITVCQQNGACTDQLGSAIEAVAQAVPETIVPQQMAPVGYSDLLEEASAVGDLIAPGEEGLDESNLVDSRSESEWAFEQFAPEANGSVSDFAADNVDIGESMAAPETDNNTEFLESVSQADQSEAESTFANVRSTDPALTGSTERSSQRVGNRFVTEAEESQPIEESSGFRKKNPFVDQSIDLSLNADDVQQVQPKTVSFEQNSSILEADQPAQASYPEPDLSQANFVQNDVAPIQSDVAPVNATLSESVAQEAVHHIEYGKSLSRRGASFGARQKFYAALGVIARGNDVQVGGNVYTTALGRATRALREVQDFTVRNADISVGISVAEILETHQTRIISDNEAAVMTPVEAMQRYFTFAHQQLSFAGGRNVVSAEALYSLGKLHSVMAKHQPETLDIAKAIVFHRAALSSDARNSRSYNELGVLLARSGQLAEAESLLKQSLQISPIAETWQNLAKIHGRQGQVQLARLAQNEFVIAAQLEPVQSPASQIAWLPGQAFNQVGPADFQDSKASTAAVVTASRTTEVEEEANDKKTFAERFNDLKNWF